MNTFLKIQRKQQKNFLLPNCFYCTLVEMIWKLNKIKWAETGHFEIRVSAAGHFVWGTQLKGSSSERKTIRLEGQTLATTLQRVEETKNKEQHICNKDKGRHKTTITKTQALSHNEKLHYRRPRQLPAIVQTSSSKVPIIISINHSHNPSHPRLRALRATASYSPLPGGGLIFICFSTSFCSSFSFSFFPPSP